MGEATSWSDDEVTPRHVIKRRSLGRRPIRGGINPGTRRSIRSSNTFVSSALPTAGAGAAALATTPTTTSDEYPCSSSQRSTMDGGGAKSSTTHKIVITTSSDDEDETTEVACSMTPRQSFATNV